MPGTVSTSGAVGEAGAEDAERPDEHPTMVMRIISKANVPTAREPMIFKAMTRAYHSHSDVRGKTVARMKKRPGRGEPQTEPFRGQMKVSRPDRGDILTEVR